MFCFHLSNIDEWCGTMKTITKNDLMAKGYSEYYASKIVKQAKQILVEQGYIFYENSRIRRIPVSVIEEVLNVSWEDTSNG